MESRLPKPNPLKRTATGVRPITANDRIALNSRLPLSADLLNLPKLTNKRHASPEFNSVQPDRAKLRRSRSACDLRPNNRMPLENFATKLNKPSTAGSENRFANNTRPKMVKQSSVSTLPLSSAGTSKSGSSSTKPINALGGSTKPASNIRKDVKKPLASTKSSVAAKRIPAYDYKARFADLQERYKLLKDKNDANQEKIDEFSTLNEQYEESQSMYFRTVEELKNEKIENECSKRQIKSQSLKLEALNFNLNENIKEVKSLNAKCEILTEENRTMKPELLELREKCKTLSEQNQYLTKELDDTQELLFKSNIDRKELHNIVMDLRGNIRVFCRVRPPLHIEDDRMLCGWQYLDDTSLEISTNELQGAQRKQTKHEFSFDQVFHPRSSQEDIFELVSPLIQSALDGYNVCIFAYGQTGSGKTFTMDGISTQVGIIPRTVDLLFKCVRDYKRLGWSYEIRATFLEIYNENLYDLLSNAQKEMDIRMVSAKNPTDIYVSNITEVTVNTANELRQLLEVAKTNRSTASTVGNERSSRSHAVTKLQLIGTHTSKNESCVGTINLVDLAGSESPKTSVRMEETKKINKSLSELTNVIMALLQRQEHIPYRNSKLTHLLMPCLGGNSKTLMFINIAPFQDCFVESVKSLRFAASVNTCKMAKAKKNKIFNTSNTLSVSSNSSTSSSATFI